MLEAANGYDALWVAQQHADEEIHLLLTDVVMPLMSGGELAAQFRVMHPGSRVMFTSGYADDVLVHHGVREGPTQFLQKPFTPSQLLHRVRGTLDR